MLSREMLIKLLRDVNDCLGPDPGLEAQIDRLEKERIGIVPPAPKFKPGDWVEHIGGRTMLVIKDGELIACQPFDETFFHCPPENLRLLTNYVVAERARKWKSSDLADILRKGLEARAMLAYDRHMII